MISIKGLKKAFRHDRETTEVLKGIDLTIEEGEFVAVMGPSGSGKSTMLHLLGGLDVPNEGTVIMNETDLSAMNDKERTIFRRRNVGLIFQNYQLLPTLTVEENIAFPLHADGKVSRDQQAFIQELIQSVGLSGTGKKRAALLSGGQQQRVAIARALVTNPAVVLADEPTGNLDREKAEDILNLMLQFNRKKKQTIVMVTHDIFAAGFADRIVLFKDGEVEQVISRKDDDYANYLAHFLA